MKSIVIVMSVLAMLVFATLAYLFTPSVFAVRSAHGLTVHCELLGEYPSDVRRIEVVEHASNRLVWRVTARGETFQLHRFDLVPGLNAGRLLPSSGTAQTDIPVQAAFDLQRGINYRASVCFTGWLNICRNVDFIL